MQVSRLQARQSFLLVIFRARQSLVVVTAKAPPARDYCHRRRRSGHQPAPARSDPARVALHPPAPAHVLAPHAQSLPPPHPSTILSGQFSALSKRNLCFIIKSAIFQ